MRETATDAHLNEPVTRFLRKDYVAIQVSHSVGDALRHAREREVGGRIVYFYVIDDGNHLLGVVPTRRLLLNPPETPIKQIMVSNVVSLPNSATLLDACELFLFHRLLALPVVDEEKRLIGLIDVELYTQEISDLARHSESADIFQLIGVHVASVRQASVPVVFRYRFPWLLCNIAGGLGCALIAGAFQDVLDAVIVLALFIPVVLALAESVSIQSLTLTLQAQHGAPPSLSAIATNLRREFPVGVMLGIACGALVGFSAWAWKGELRVALCILTSILLSIVFATIFGLLVPTTLRMVQRDPRVASGPITLALTDLATMTIYLGLAAWAFA